MSIIYLRRIQSQAALVSASPAARRDAALPPSPPGAPPVLGVPSTSPARGSGRTRMCSDGTAGGRKPHRQGGQAGSRRARFGLPNLCRKNREALADRFLWMAPLRLTGRSVAAGSFRAAIVRCARSDRHQEEVTSGELTAGHGIPGTGIGPPQDRPGAAHPRQRI